MKFHSPLAMSQPKDELLKHLDMSLDIYNKMAKETDHVYKKLISDKRHLKSNCMKSAPPYDWSDMMERSKDHAMEQLAKSGSPETSLYWNLAGITPNCPNWIARWFLYHVFRYRDGRNRGASNKKHNSGSRQSRYQTGNKPKDEHARPEEEYETSNAEYMLPSLPSINKQETTSYALFPQTEQRQTYSAQPDEYMVSPHTGTYWDPVRDAVNEK